MRREDEERITTRVMSSAERMMAALSQTGYKHVLSKTYVYYDETAVSAKGKTGYKEIC